MYDVKLSVEKNFKKKIKEIKNVNDPCESEGCLSM